jgi:tRNA pseudouridine13 synthase
MSTHELIGQVASDFSVHPKHIGYSGLKDKQAVTRQWLSLHLPGQQALFKLPRIDRYQLLDHGWHNRKLRTGTHRFNRFEVLLRDVAEMPDSTLKQLRLIGEQGFANYFGAQRFGRNQDNVEQALKQLGRRKLGRSKKSLYLSSLRSHLFNRILSERISLGHWQKPLQGDVFMLSGTHSIFSENLDSELLQRFQSQDISSTASLYGSGQCQLSGLPLKIENQVFSEHEDITRCLDRQGAKRQMRALRVAVEDFNYLHDRVEKTLLLKLRLPAGCYMTTLLDHFVETHSS